MRGDLFIWFGSVTIFMMLLAPVQVTGQVFLTRDEALRQYFPEPLSIDRRTLFLNDQQVAAIQNRSSAKVPSKMITYYVGRKGRTIVGYAFFETHTVRTMPEVLMLVIDPDSTVRATEILAFYEPEDYLPPKRWLALFHDKRSTDDLWLKRGISNIVGATLSAQTITDAVRRYLALFETAIPKE